MEREPLYNTLAEIRKTHNLTQQELAEKAGVSRQTIISIEKGHYTPSILLVLKIAQIFSCPVENIFSLDSLKDN